MHSSDRISYLEYPAINIPETKSFFKQVFNWEFEDYGTKYCAFTDSSGINGGFYQSEFCSRTENGAALTVFYASNIKQTQANIEATGGKILQAIFSFPGGVRFHFLDPNGNEFAVWSESEN